MAGPRLRPAAVAARSGRPESTGRRRIARLAAVVVGRSVKRPTARTAIG
ncbi:MULTISPECIES: hypothetical protein [unclassified Streptomyces]